MRANSKDQNPISLCFYCKNKGHVMADCWKREKNARPNSLAVPHWVQQTSGSGTVPLSPESQFNLFVSKGTVSLSSDGEKLPITILRDTGEIQTLIVEGTLSLSEETATGGTMFIQGVELAPVSVPLHTVYLRCGLVTGPVVVEARPSIPIQGIVLLLGNDLAGNKVIPGLAVDNNPELAEDVDKLDSPILDFSQLVQSPEPQHDEHPYSRATLHSQSSPMVRLLAHRQQIARFQGMSMIGKGLHTLLMIM